MRWASFSTGSESSDPTLHKFKICSEEDTEQRCKPKSVCSLCSGHCGLGVTGSPEAPQRRQGAHNCVQYHAVLQEAGICLPSDTWSRSGTEQGGQQPGRVTSHSTISSSRCSGASANYLYLAEKGDLETQAQWHRRLRNLFAGF